MEYTQEQKLIRKLAREIAETSIFPAAAAIDETDVFPEALFSELAAAGLFGMTIPAAYGGSEAGVLACALAEEEIARGAGVAEIYVSSPNSLSGYPIAAAGTEEQKRRYLPGMVAGEFFIAFAMTEPNAGSDPAALSTGAERTAGGYLLNGRKCFITGSTFAKYAVTLAKTEPEKGVKGITAFVVDLDSPGVSRGNGEKKMGLHGCGTGDLVFNDVFVPDSDLLGRPGGGYFLAMNTLDLGRIGVASQAVGIAQRAFEEAVSFAKERRQFGRPIASFQSIGFMLADMKTRLEAARLLTHDAAASIDRGERATVKAAMAKYYAAEAAVDIVSKAVQIHGGYGYINGYTVERLYRDVRVLPLYEGTSQIQQILIAKEITR